MCIIFIIFSFLSVYHTCISHINTSCVTYILVSINKNNIIIVEKIMGYYSTELCDISETSYE
nr:MAG TPA: hypothetical protein [Caudoviricetes sp.]